MDLALFGRYFLDFALLYPSAFLCLASLWEKLRTPRRTACIAAGCITLLCIGCAALCAVFGLNSNSLLPAIVLVSFWLLRWRVTPEVTVSQTAFLFSISAVMMAVCSLLSTLLNAQTEISNPQTVCLASTALLRLGLAAMLTVLFWFTAVQWSRWLLREYSGEAFWQSAWPLPALYAVFLVYCMPLNPAVDALAGYYDHAAGQQSVPVEWKLALPRQLPMPEADLCTILGNLLENALHASQKLPPEQRRVQVMAQMLSPAMLGLVVENRYDGMLKKQQGILRSTKHEGTGIGLVSAETVVHKYNGNLHLETEEQIFRVNVLLNL